MILNAVVKMYTGRWHNLKRKYGIFGRYIEECQAFSLTYQDRISETMFRKFAVKKSQTVYEELDKEQPFIASEV